MEGGTCVGAGEILGIWEGGSWEYIYDQDIYIYIIIKE